MARTLRRMLFPALLATAAAAPAQDAPKAGAAPVDSSEVVVTARRETETEIRDFVGALTEAPVTGQLSRFETSQVCPLAVGVSPSQAQAIVARMRLVAKRAEVPVAKPGCVANILVVVTGDKKAFIEALMKKQRYYLGKLTDAQARKLADDPAPAAAWQLAGPQLNADGQEIWVDYEFAPTNKTGRGASRISMPARPQFAAAMVVIDSRALDGLTTIQLADYAAMRTYARTDPARLATSGAPTILKVLDAPMGTAVPITLTGWDLGFLRALYAVPDNLTAGSQRTAMRKSLGAELKADPPRPQ